MRFQTTGGQFVSAATKAEAAALAAQYGFGEGQGSDESDHGPPAGGRGAGLAALRSGLARECAGTGSGRRVVRSRGGLGMKEIFSARSTNGRWGLAVVGPEGTTFPAQGSLRHVGKVAGMATYEFTPGETGAWVATAGDVTVHGGATLVASEDLQSSQVATLLLLGPQAVVEHHGYKRRSSRVVAYVAGVETDIPGTVLAAMGLLQADGEVVVVEPPPVLGGAMAAAFAALRN